MLCVLKQIFTAMLIATYASQASAMFIQPDWFDPTQPGVGTNRYAYSFNDPVNQTDPGGNCAWDACVLEGYAVGSFITWGLVTLGVIGAGVATGVAIDQMTQPDPYAPRNEGFTPSGDIGPGILSTPSGEVSGIDIVSVPEAGLGGIIVSTPDGQVMELPNYVEARGNTLKPDPNATGAHTTPKYGPDGKITGYQEWTPNPQNPTGFDAGRRVDVTGKPHTNKDGTRVPTPHVHEPGEKDVRPAEPDELPK